MTKTVFFHVTETGSTSNTGAKVVPPGTIRTVTFTGLQAEAFERAQRNREFMVLLASAVRQAATADTPDG